MRSATRRAPSACTPCSACASIRCRRPRPHLPGDDDPANDHVDGTDQDLTTHPARRYGSSASCFGRTLFEMGSLSRRDDGSVSAQGSSWWMLAVAVALVAVVALLFR